MRWRNCRSRSSVAAVYDRRKITQQLLHRRLMAARIRIQQCTDPLRKTSEILHQIFTKIAKGDLRRCNHKQAAQKHKIQQINENERKKRSVIAQISLVFWNHPAGEGKMERPGTTVNGVEKLAVRRDVHEQAGDPINENRVQAIERKKIQSERDQDTCPVGDDMAAIAARPTLTDTTVH